MKKTKNIWGTIAVSLLASVIAGCGGSKEPEVIENFDSYISDCNLPGKDGKITVEFCSDDPLAYNNLDGLMINNNFKRGMKCETAVYMLHANN